MRNNHGRGSGRDGIGEEEEGVVGNRPFEELEEKARIVQGRGKGSR